jgi:hypothetical protein
MPQLKGVQLHGLVRLGISIEEPKMKRLFLSACALIRCASASSAEEPARNNDDFKTEFAVTAKKELANFASNILAATVCKGAKFNSEGRPTTEAA